MADYITPAEFLKRFDWRDVGDLVSDDRDQVAKDQLATDVNLLAAIADASGEIETALVIGGKYSASDLENLTGNSLAKLRRVCAELTMFYLLERRPRFDSERLEAFEKLRDRHLKRLKSGENVFNLTDHVNAGVVDVDGPTTQQYDDLNLWRDRTKNYFPARHLPNNR